VGISALSGLANFRSAVAAGTVANASASSSDTSSTTSSVTSSTSSSSSAALDGYRSPVVQFDSIAELSVTVYRDTSTGATTAQLPPAQVVREYERNGGQSGSELAAAARSAESTNDLTTASSASGDTSTAASSPAGSATGQLVSLGV
jgi:hypothetical protein